MAQYPIPQFIEEEGKIISFLTFRQFFWLVGGGAISLGLYFVLPLFLFIIAAIAIVGGAAVIAFVKIGNESILRVVLNFFGFMGKTKNYTWQKKDFAYPFKKRREIKTIPDATIPSSPNKPASAGFPNVPSTPNHKNPSNLAQGTSRLNTIKNRVETKK